MPHLMPMSWILCFTSLLICWFLVFLLFWKFIWCKSEILTFKKTLGGVSKFNFTW